MKNFFIFNIGSFLNCLFFLKFSSHIFTSQLTFLLNNICFSIITAKYVKKVDIIMRIIDFLMITRFLFFFPLDIFLICFIYIQIFLVLIEKYYYKENKYIILNIFFNVFGVVYTIHNKNNLFDFISILIYCLLKNITYFLIIHVIRLTVLEMLRNKR